MACNRRVSVFIWDRDEEPVRVRVMVMVMIRLRLRVVVNTARRLPLDILNPNPNLIYTL